MGSKESIWGDGDKITSDLISKTELNGNWLNLGAGDGRYIRELLEKVDNITASDIDEKELKKLQSKLSEKQKNKVSISIFDLTEKFPFEDETFDGVFCVGTLHLFKKEVLKQIFSEIKRILKKKCKIIFDFSTDIKRIPYNKEIEEKFPTIYKKEEAKALLKDLLKEFSLTIKESSYEDDLTNVPGYGFKTSGKFILVLAEKS